MNELVSLTDAKAALYEALQPFSLNGCFLRFSDTPEGLLVCDLPRRGGDLSGAEEALTHLGWRLLPGKKPGLWLLDRADAVWQDIAGSLALELPAFPKREEDFAAYSLCRLLLLHPAPLAVQPMELNRAALLRQGKPLPTLGGQLLNVHLQNQKGA